MNNPALNALRYHVSGAIARGEAVAIVEQRQPLKATISIKIGSSVSVDFNPTFGRWYHTDDGLNWQGLPRNIRNAQTAIDYAARYYGINMGPQS